MIPTAFLQAWSTKAPWPDLRQVEQDLIICRALCDLFSAPALAGKIAFRGGTAIHKLLFKQPLRYSEDIDLVQTHPEPIGGTVDAIRAGHRVGEVELDLAHRATGRTLAGFLHRGRQLRDFVAVARDRRG